MFPPLESYKFPRDILGDPLLDAALAPRRLDANCAACRDPGANHSGIVLRHQVTGSGCSPLPAECADMILSQSVLTYVPNLDGQYRSMARLLKPGGFMTHQNDYSVELLFGCRILEQSLGMLRNHVVAARTEATLRD